MMGRIEAGSAFIIGMIVGGLGLCIALFSGSAKVITSDFTCTKTEIVGSAPNRREECVKYERKGI